MQKTLCNRLYDTETAALIRQFSRGCYGDPAGYEERLYRTPEGYYFLYGVGGKDSPFPRETLRRISADAAETWIQTHG